MVVTPADPYVAQLATALNAVIQAETSKIQENVDSARILVNALHESDKISLSARLDAINVTNLAPIPMR